MKRIILASILFFVAFYFLLIALHKSPPTWDDAWYLLESVGFYRQWTLVNLWQFLKVFSRAFNGIKAPLISVLPLPFYLIFGTSLLSAMLVNACFVFIFSWLTVKLVRHIGGTDLAALFSVIIINTLPLFHTFVRQFLVEYGLSFLAMAGVYLLLKTNYFKQAGYANILGVVLGLGLLMKVLYPFYLLGPALAILFFAIKKRRNANRKALMLNILRVLIIGASLAAIWYAFNWKSVLLYAYHSSFGQFSQAHALGGVFSLAAVWKYLRNFIQDGLSLYYFLVFLFCLLLLVCKRRARELRFKDDLIVFIWFLLPFAVLLFARNKILRFLLPALAPFAIVLGIWIERLFKKRGVLLLLIPIAGFILNPFLPSPFFKQLCRSPVIDTRSDWKINAVLDALTERAKADDVILCAMDHQYYNNLTLEYYGSLRWLPYTFVNLNFCPDWSSVVRLINRENSILIKSKDFGPDYSNPYSARIREVILNNQEAFGEAASIQLPDNSSISLYQRKGQPNFY